MPNTHTSNIMYCVIWVPCHLCIAYTQVADGGDD